MKEELQVESGNFTRIINPLIEQLIRVPFKGCELSVAFFIIRKTYGYQKTEDELSLSQIQEGVNRSRQTVVTALKNLQLVNILRLVKRGDANGSSNIWAINKYYDTWKLVNMARLVKRNNKPSLTERLNLVYTARHTKETTKETKEITTTVIQSDSGEGSETSKLEMLKTIWNGRDTVYSVPQREIGGREIKNHSAKEKLLPTCRKITADIEVAFNKLIKKGYSGEDFRVAIENYTKDIISRDPSSDYSSHRFSFYEFLKQENGFITYINK